MWKISWKAWGIVGILGVVGAIAYVDYRRRRDPEYRKKLSMCSLLVIHPDVRGIQSLLEARRRRVEKEKPLDAKKASDKSSSPEALQQYVMKELQTGEQLLQAGVLHLPASRCFY